MYLIGPFTNPSQVSSQSLRGNSYKRPKPNKHQLKLSTNLNKRKKRMFVISFGKYFGGKFLAHKNCLPKTGCLLG